MGTQVEPSHGDRKRIEEAFAISALLWNDQFKVPALNNKANRGMVECVKSNPTASKQTVCSGHDQSQAGLGLWLVSLAAPWMQSLPSTYVALLGFFEHNHKG